MAPNRGTSKRPFDTVASTCPGGSQVASWATAQGDERVSSGPQADTDLERAARAQTIHSVAVGQALQWFRKPERNAHGLVLIQKMGSEQ